ncbi:MAG TPA: hypothetical protein VMK66_06880 [Myxococcales bacterium]|nr:hypothetical protein [Myxococcales bacterium]
MFAPFDTLPFGLPGHPLELIAVVLIADAVGLAVLAAIDLARTRRERQTH